MFNIFLSTYLVSDTDTGTHVSHGKQEKENQNLCLKI